MRAAKDVVALDELIVKHAENWRLERLALIDRAILRLAMHELRATDTPPKVVLNEAVDLAKKFSSEDAGAFVNGILDAFRKTIGAARRRGKIVIAEFGWCLERTANHAVTWKGTASLTASKAPASEGGRYGWRSGVDGAFEDFYGGAADAGD